MTPNKLSHPPVTPPQCTSISSLVTIIFSIFPTHLCVILSYTLGKSFALLQGYRHLFLYGTRILYVARYIEELCSRIAWSSETNKPGATTTTNGRSNCDSFHVGDCSGTPKDSDVSREWGLQAWLSLEIGITNQLISIQVLSQISIPPVTCFPSNDSMSAVSSPQM